MRYFIQFLLLLGLIHSIYAESIDAKIFTNHQQERRYRQLIDEIRCPVCQGQSISGSNAILAKDLRKQVQSMIIQGSHNDEIYQFMIDRFGDFVVFKPPVNKNTYFLWFAPFVLLAFSLFFFINSLSKNKTKATNTTITDTAKAKKLLNN